MELKEFEDNGADMVITIRFVNDPVLDDYLLYQSGAKQVLISKDITTVGYYNEGSKIDVLGVKTIMI